MKPNLSPEDLFLSGLLLQHRILDAGQLDLLQQSVTSQPGMKLADLLVETSMITYQQRKALTSILESDNLRGVLTGALPPSALLPPGGASPATPDASQMLPAGIRRDMAATRIYATEEAERMAAIEKANEQALLEATRNDPTGMMVTQQLSKLTEDQPIGAPEFAGRRDASTTERPGATTGMEATLVERSDAPEPRERSVADAFDGIFEQTGQKTVVSDAATLTDASSAQTIRELPPGAADPSMVATMPSNMGVDSLGPDKSRSRWSMMSEFLGGDGGNVDLLSASSAGGFDISNILTAEELTRVRESSRKAGSGLIGHKIGGYVVIDKLGEGGQGEVFLAKQLSLSRYVALKVLPKAYAYDPEFVDRFIHEANMLAKLSHSNVVRIFDVNRANDMLYLTMENIQGQSLKDLIVKEEQVPLDISINIVKQCCRALGRVKKEGITHRDIKPGNILLDQHGEVKVVDFGLADISKDLEKRDSGHTAGTPYYMPPESIKNLPATHLSDQYSLGATFFHMLAGRPPYKANTITEMANLHLEGAIPRCSDFNPIIPREIDLILQKMLAKKPEDRFASFREVFEALEAVELKLGMIASSEDFLGDGLINLRKANIRNLKRNIAWWAFVSGAFTFAAMGTNAFLRKTLDGGDAAFWIDHAGNWGTYLVGLAYLAILYVGMVRRRWVPAFGSIRRWIQVHIFTALCGSFLVFVHSGNFLRDYLPLFTGGQFLKPTSFLPLLNTIALVLVVASGMIGRYIFRDLQKQAALERISADAVDAEERTPESKLALILISQRVMGYWRVVHYPLTIIFWVLTIAHVVSILYFGGSLMAVHPDTGWFPGSQQ